MIEIAILVGKIVVISWLAVVAIHLWSLSMRCHKKHQPVSGVIFMCVGISFGLIAFLMATQLVCEEFWRAAALQSMEEARIWQNTTGGQ